MSTLNTVDARQVFRIRGEFLKVRLGTVAARQVFRIRGEFLEVRLGHHQSCSIRIQIWIQLFKTVV